MTDPAEISRIPKAPYVTVGGPPSAGIPYAELASTYKQMAVRFMMEADMWHGLRKRCEEMVQTGLYGHKTPDTMMVAIIKGCELGWSPMASLERIKVIKGTPVIRGASAVAMIMAAGFTLECRTSTVDLAEWWAERAGKKGKLFTYTREEADATGVPNDNPKKTWQRFPAQMLKWACASTAAKEYFADVLGGFEVEEALALEPGPDPALRRQEMVALSQLTEARIAASGANISTGEDAWVTVKAGAWAETKAKLAQQGIVVEDTDDFRRISIETMEVMRAELGG